MNSTFFDKKSSHKQLKAVVNDDVLNVITKMGGIMQERGYPLKNLQSARRIEKRVGHGHGAHLQS
nr:DUF6175 family protein [Hallella mizrahii]